MDTHNLTRPVDRDRLQNIAHDIDVPRLGPDARKRLRHHELARLREKVGLDVAHRRCIAMELSDECLPLGRSEQGVLGRHEEPIREQQVVSSRSQHDHSQRRRVYAPSSRNDHASSPLIPNVEHTIVFQDLRRISILLHDLGQADRRRPRIRIHARHLQVRQDGLHRVGRHEREPRVRAVLRELVGERPEDEAPEHAAEPGPAGVALAVGEAPAGHVVRREVGGVEPVAARERDGVAQDRAADRVCCARSLACVV